mgnify:CR=1 FL=1
MGAIFSDAANEAGISRLYGGIHFQDTDLRARELGKKIGSNAYSYASALWSGSGTPKSVTSEPVSNGLHATSGVQAVGSKGAA